MPERANPVRARLGEAQFRRLCAGEPVSILALGDRRIEIVLERIPLVPMLRAVLDGALPPDIAERGKR